MFRNTSVYIILMFVAISLSSCSSGEIPEGELSKEDLYGNYAYEAGPKITILIRKDVYRVRIAWKDGTKYESNWEKWRLNYSDTDSNSTYQIDFSEFAPYLYCNWEEDSRTNRETAPTENELSSIEKAGDSAYVYRFSGDLGLDVSFDPGRLFMKVSTSDGTVKPEDEPPKEESDEPGESSESEQSE